MQLSTQLPNTSFFEPKTSARTDCVTPLLDDCFTYQLLSEAVFSYNTSVYKAKYTKATEEDFWYLIILHTVYDNVEKKHLAL